MNTYLRVVSHTQSVPRLIVLGSIPGLLQMAVSLDLFIDSATFLLPGRLHNIAYVLDYARSVA